MRDEPKNEAADQLGDRDSGGGLLGLLAVEAVAGHSPVVDVAHPREKSIREEAAHPREEEVSHPRVEKAALPDPLPAKVVSILPRVEAKKKAAQGGKSKPKRKKTVKTPSALGRKRAEKIGEEEAEWLKEFLPRALQPGWGWWDVSAQGAGFIIKFRWSVAGKTPALPFPRISREQFIKLREMKDDERRTELYERIAGHLEDITFDPERADRARLVATRIGIELEDYRNARTANYGS